MTQTDQLIPSVLIAIGGLVGNFFLIRHTTRIPEKAPSSSREESTAAAAAAAEERERERKAAAAARAAAAEERERKAEAAATTIQKAVRAAEERARARAEARAEARAAEKRGAEETKAADAAARAAEKAAEKAARAAEKAAGKSVATRVESDVDPFAWPEGNTDGEFQKFPEDAGTQTESRQTMRIDSPQLALLKKAAGKSVATRVESDVDPFAWPEGNTDSPQARFSPRLRKLIALPTEDQVRAARRQETQALPEEMNSRPRDAGRKAFMAAVAARLSPQIDDELAAGSKAGPAQAQAITQATRNRIRESRNWQA